VPFLKLDDLKEHEILPGCHVRFIHSERMSFAYWHFDPDATIPPHSHPHEQVGTMIEGELEVTIDGVTRHLTPGCVLVVPSNSMHSVRALSRCYVIDAFCPVREDYRQKFGDRER
jgi:quercetin dioxygenase-like cupin family protein